jgi:molybdopterin molybdotransferase
MCTIIFVLPLIEAMLGEVRPAAVRNRLPLEVPLPENGPRQHYMRARIVEAAGGAAVEPLPSQDSSLTAALASADCLIVRPAHAPAAPAGEPVLLLSFNDRKII